jgi:hypothetical protein
MTNTPTVICELAAVEAYCFSEPCTDDIWYKFELGGCKDIFILMGYR